MSPWASACFYHSPDCAAMAAFTSATGALPKMSRSQHMRSLLRRHLAEDSASDLQAMDPRVSAQWRRSGARPGRSPCHLRTEGSCCTSGSFLLRDFLYDRL